MAHDWVLSSIFLSFLGNLVCVIVYHWLKIKHVIMLFWASVILQPTPQIFKQDVSQILTEGSFSYRIITWFPSSSVFGIPRGIISTGPFDIASEGFVGFHPAPWISDWFADISSAHWFLSDSRHGWFARSRSLTNSSQHPRGISVSRKYYCAASDKYA